MFIKKKIFNLHIINIFKFEQHDLIFTNHVTLYKPYFGLNNVQLLQLMHVVQVCWQTFVLQEVIF